MARAYVDAPLDQKVTPEMVEAIDSMLVDLTENHSVTEFCMWQQEISFHVEKALRKLKARYPDLRIINLRTHDVSDWESDDLNEYLEVDSIKKWEEANCQIRMVMYLCSMCFREKDGLPCERRDIIDVKVPFPLQIVRLADYVKTEK